MMKSVKALFCATLMAIMLVVTTGPMSVMASEATTTGEDVIVTYDDGVNGEAFDQIQIRVKQGAQIPDIGMTPTRNGFIFAGWTPSVSGTAEEDVTYTATWKGDDSLLDSDREMIRKNADATKSNVSVADVDGKVIAGKIGDDVSSNSETSMENNTETMLSEGESMDTAGKQDVLTDDVDTGDINVGLYAGIAAAMMVIIGGAIFVLKRKTSNK